MKINFSRSWKGSTQRRKQRKYSYNAPLHTRTTLLTVSLHKTLREKYGARNLPLRKGDKVKVMRGYFKGKESIVEKVDRKKGIALMENVRVSKKDGSEVPVGIKTSNLQIVSVHTDDKKRFKKQSKESKDSANLARKKDEKLKEAKEVKSVKQVKEENKSKGK